MKTDKPKKKKKLVHKKKEKNCEYIIKKTRFYQIDPAQKTEKKLTKNCTKKLIHYSAKKTWFVLSMDDLGSQTEKF